MVQKPGSSARLLPSPKVPTTAKSTMSVPLPTTIVGFAGSMAIETSPTTGTSIPGASTLASLDPASVGATQRPSRQVSVDGQLALEVQRRGWFPPQSHPARVQKRNAIRNAGIEVRMS